MMSFLPIRKFIELKEAHNIQGLIVKKGECREINLKSGKTTIIQKIIIQDTSAKISITLWGKNCQPNFGINDKVQLIGVYVKKNPYNNQPEAQLLPHGKIIRIAWPKSLDFLPLKEREFLIELKRLIKKNIPIKQKIDRKSYGLSIKSGHISALSIYMAGLPKLPQSIGNLPYIQSLFLNNNHLKNIPLEIGFLENLTHLDLRWNQLTNLPSTIQKLTNLEYLNIKSNKFTNLPKEIAELPNLTKIMIKDNNFRKLSVPLPRALRQKYIDHYPSDLPEVELSVLITLELLLGEPIPEVSYIGRKTFGFMMFKNRITGLGLYFRNLKDFPPSILKIKQLSVLNISYNSFIELPKLEKMLPKLRTIYAQGNRWNAIPSSILEIQSYKYQNDNISTSEKQALSILGFKIGQTFIRMEKWDSDQLGYQIKNNAVIGLSLPNQDFQEIPAEIDFFSQLRNLSLKFNQLSKFPSTIKNFSKLENLDLSHNNINSIPNWFGPKNNQYMRKLNFSSNNITKLSPSITKFQNLELLKINSNKITNFTLNFPEDTKIKLIQACNNEILELSINYSSCRYLEVIEFAYNHIHTLPAEIFELPMLKIINFNYNRISVIPNSFFNCPVNLKINLAYNQLQLDKKQLQFLKEHSQNPEELEKTQITVKKSPYSSLREEEQRVMQTLEIILNEPIPKLNRIKMRDFGYKQELGHVTKLSLYQKELSFFPEVITNLDTLRWLQLSNNRIKYLPDTISNLKRLERLILSYNQIESLPSSIGTLKMLKKLKLDNNNLSNLPSSFEILTSITNLSLNNNNFNDIPGEIWNLSHLQNLPFKLDEFQGESQNKIRKGIKAVLTYAQRKRFFYEEILKALEMNQEMPSYIRNFPKICQIAPVLEEKCQYYHNEAAKELRKILQELCSIKINDFNIIL